MFTGLPNPHGLIRYVLFPWAVDEKNEFRHVQASKFSGKGGGDVETDVPDTDL